jgi:hypothetical protein
VEWKILPQGALANPMLLSNESAVSSPHAELAGESSLLNLT